MSEIGACRGGKDLHPEIDNIAGHCVGKDSAVPHKRKAIQVSADEGESGTHSDRMQMVEILVCA